MWLVFALVSTLLWGCAELFYKKGARQEEPYSHLKICVCVGAVMGLHACFTLATQNIGYDPRNLLIYSPVALCYILSMACSFYGVRFIEESISDPVENTSGAMCSLMCAALLGTRISGGSVVAIILMLVGILGIGFQESHGEIKRSDVLGKRLAVIAFAMPFCYAIIDAIGSFLDIYYLDMKTSPLVGVSGATIEEVANTSYELSFALVAIVLLVFMRAKRVSFGLQGQRDKIVAALFETAGQFTYVFAMSGNGAIAAPILSSVCVISLILSRIFLKEKLTAKQYAFIACVIAGILLLAIIEGE